jgi:GNAT superfamily N-acetyltransferase
MEVSSLELGRLDLSPLATLESARRSEGFELASLADVADLRGIHAVYAAGEEDMPSDEPETELDYETWAAETLGHPDMSGEESVVVLADGRPVGLAFLTLDRDRKLGYNEMTATAPGFRRRGLGLLAKLEASRRAIGAGVERLLTENDGENDGMLAINRRLGYATVMVDQQFLRR